MSLKTTLRLASPGSGGAIRWPDRSSPRHIVFARTQIESLAAGLSPVKIPPRELLEIKKRLLTAAQDGALDQVRNKDWRYAPWVFWLNDDAVAANENIVEAYFARAQGRRSSGWIKSLVFSYFMHFPVSSPTLPIVAGRLREVLAAQKWPSLYAWNQRQTQLKLFEPDKAPKHLAGRLLECDSTHQELVALGLDASITQTANNRFMAGSYTAALPFARLILSDGHTAPEKMLSRLIEWSEPIDRSSPGLRYPALRGALADSLLLPWSARQPSETIKDTIKKFLLARIGDPRLQPIAWEQANPRATEIFRRWLAGDTLRQFFDLLSRTADPIWAYRKKFWTAYYNHGAIGDAWFALGPNAHFQGSQIRARQSDLRFAVLSGAGVQQNQSVLIMRLGDFIIAEWSHNGKCRIWRDSDNRAPCLYEKQYNSTDLRSGCEYEQVHHWSESGTWQRQINDYLRRETRIYIPAHQWM
jgi:hypothetical protein